MESLRTLVEITHHAGLDLAGRRATREAARAIILRGRTLLMIYSRTNGDYKFPGGGIEPGESHAAALLRELQEECGASQAAIGQPFGQAIEYSRSIEAEFEVFQMTSYYYRCETNGELGGQKLDRYEQELGFTPVWVEIETAIRRNADLLTDPTRKAPRWTRRELAVLERIRMEMLSDPSPEKMGGG